MVSSGGSGTSSAPNIPAPSGQLNPTPGGAAPSYPSFLANLGPGQMASGLTPQMIQQIQGSGYSATPPPMMQPQMAGPPPAPPPVDRRVQLARAMQQQQQQLGLGRNGGTGGGGAFGGGMGGGGRGGN